MIDGVVEHRLEQHGPVLVVPRRSARVNVRKEIRQLLLEILALIEEHPRELRVYGKSGVEGRDDDTIHVVNEEIQLEVVHVFGRMMYFDKQRGCVNVHLVVT